jgi:phenylalanyl-tRNA synthetase alpha chain
LEETKGQGEQEGKLKEVGKLPVSERPALGQMVNQLKAALEQATERALEEERERQKGQRLLGEEVDYSLPGRGRLRAENTSSLR